MGRPRRSAASTSPRRTQSCSTARPRGCWQGEPKDIAVVIPVPTFIERKQICVVEMKAIDHLDAFTAPRLVEYYDPDPCAQLAYKAMAASSVVPAPPTKLRMEVRSRGVTVEATYDVG